MLNYAGGSGAPRRDFDDGRWDDDNEFSYYVLRAFQLAYPDRGLELERRGGEWGLVLDGKWYAWAGGRFLPEAERKNKNKFKLYGVYYYPDKLPPQPVFTPEAEREFRSKMEDDSQPLPLHRGFIGDLYQIHSRAEAESRMKLMSLGGKRVRLNALLQPVLAELDEDVARLRQQDAEVERFFRRVKSISGFNWRNVSYFGGVSYHSFGLALDFLPAKWDAPVYWYWSKDLRSDWYNIPYSKRWRVPESLVKVFESHGFLWGGKWLFFDNMHFEYRPELLRLQNMPRELWPREGGASHLRND